MNSAEKNNLSENENENWNISTKLKRKKKNTHIQRTLFSGHSPKYIPANYTKICKALSFLSPFFLFLLYKIRF